MVPFLVVMLSASLADFGLSRLTAEKRILRFFKFLKAKTIFS
jgi:hypothetical protein